MSITTLLRPAFLKPRHAIPLPFAIVSIEHYGRMKRLLDRDVPVRVELNLDTEVTGKDVEGLNVLADLPGVDPARRNEVVMAAAHLDSWAAGTGATDDGAGVVIVMEAIRILRALDLTPRRTIRLALWTGEEQGALGSLSYVNREVAKLPRATTPAQLGIPSSCARDRAPHAWARTRTSVGGLHVRCRRREDSRRLAWRKRGAHPIFER